MSTRIHRGVRLRGRTLTGALTGAGALSIALLPATAAAAAAAPVTAGVTALSLPGVLVVVGDAQPNDIVLSRTPDGAILVNGGAVRILGTKPTVDATAVLLVASGAGDDVVTFDELNGPLPGAVLAGGEGNDALTGGSGADTLAGQRGNDTLLAKAGDDALDGGEGDDTVVGGGGTDTAAGQSGDDRLVWNPGDGTDVNDGGDGVDVTEVNGGGGAEQFTETAVGTRVRFDRLTPAPFSIDMGTVEHLVLNANGGDDSFVGSGSLAGLITTTVDGGVGNDTISGTNGADVLVGGAGSDRIDGQQGADIARLGSEDDVFTWDPGDGSDVVEGETGLDTMVFNGNDTNEKIAVSANGPRARLFRDIGNITMDTDDVERFAVNARGGADEVVVGDLTGTDVTEVATDLARDGVDDGAADVVTVNGTAGADVATLTGDGTAVEVHGPTATVTVTGAAPASDRLTVAALAGDDVIDASAVAAGAVPLVLDGGDDDDVLIGGDGNDTIFGGAGDDVLEGGPGIDALDDGPGDDVVLQ